jgi:hypothetical protein
MTGVFVTSYFNFFVHHSSMTSYLHQQQRFTTTNIIFLCKWKVHTHKDPIYYYIAISLFILFNLATVHARTVHKLIYVFILLLTSI